MNTSLLNRMMVWTLPYVPKPLLKVFAQRYVAGETMADMVKTVRALNQQGILATVDLLGEFIHHIDKAHETAQTYKKILEIIQQENLQANISVKLTALGLLLDPVVCEQLMVDLVRHAADHNNFVRIDMEDSDCTQATIDLYLRLRQEYANVGIVLQAYLKRTYSDMEHIIDSGAGHFRLCKGIYVEPETIAYKDHDAINQNYLHILEGMFQKGAYVGIATHDEFLAHEAEKRITQFNLSPDRYEFQMLLGVTASLRGQLLQRGHKLRVYVPFGQEWHAYCIRRLKENPKIAGYVLQNLFKQLLGKH